MTSNTYTARELAEITNCKLIGDADITITGINTLENANDTEVSFLANPRYFDAMTQSKAPLICISNIPQDLLSKTYLVSNDPSKTFQEIAELLLPPQKSQSGFSGIHPTAVIHETAKIGKNVNIGPFSVIDQDAIIGDNTTICSHVYIGTATSIGEDCLLHPSTTIRERCTLKDRVILQPGAVIGSCGFGYSTDKTGKHTKLEQLGTVIIEEDVEIGANTAIDRARFKATIVGRGTKIDNLVQIAHNVEIGKNNIHAAQTGIAGSAKTGDRVMCGGQVGVLGHVEITNDVLIATRSGVSKSLKKSGKYRGAPAVPVPEYNKQFVHGRKIESYLERIKILEEKMKELELTRSPT